MHNTWQLQEAKNKFSQVVEEALTKGPQIVTRHGDEEVVILSIEDYRKMNKPKSGLISFLRSSPLAGSGLDLNRSRDLGRKVDF